MTFFGKSFRIALSSGSSVIALGLTGLRFRAFAFLEVFFRGRDIRDESYQAC